jgi:hypothetical protein
MRRDSRKSRNPVAKDLADDKFHQRVVNPLSWRSNENSQFRSKFSEDIFRQKYAHEGAETWNDLAATC